MNKEKILEISRVTLVIIMIMLMLLLSIKMVYGNYTLARNSIVLSIIGGIGLVLYIIGKIHNFNFSKVEIFIFVMMAFSCLSLIGAININDAIFGKAHRAEGLLIWLTYDILMLNMLSIKKKEFIYAILFAIVTYAIINFIYGLFQVDIIKSPLFFVRKTTYAKGFLGNSMGFGTLMSIFYGFSLGLFVKCEGKTRKIISGVLALIASAGVIISGNMSAMLTVAVIDVFVFICIVVLLIKKNKKAWMQLVCLFGIIGAFVLMYNINANRDPHLKNDVTKFLTESQSISKGTISEKFGSGRIHIWKNALLKLPNHIIMGVGIDNFYNAFDGKLIDVASGLVVDKAHNDYLQKMLCESVVSGLFFIFFLLYIFFKGLKRKLPPLYYGLLLAFSCYSIQAFFNISVTRVAPIFYVITGLLIGKLNEEKETK